MISEKESEEILEKTRIKKKKKNDPLLKDLCKFRKN